MSNKVRNKDGNFKYPYQAVLPFIQVQTLMEELKGNPETDHIFRDNKSYGAKLWGGTRANRPYDQILDIFRKYIPDFDLSKTYVWINDYHGTSLHYEIYIAYAEFDKEV